MLVIRRGTKRPDSRGLRSLLKIPFRWRILAFTLFAAASSTLVSEEYWQTWIHSTDAQAFDGEAFSFGPLDGNAARASGNYVAVARDKGGLPIEAVQMLGVKPNYHYIYWYDEKGRPLLRRFEYWGGGAFHRMSEVPSSQGLTLSFFHAMYGDAEVEIDLRTLGVIAGKLPPRALGLVMEWAAVHRAELLEDWELARLKKTLNPIPPLE